MFYSLHETFIVNVYYSETLYCTIKLVLSELLMFMCLNLGAPGRLLVYKVLHMYYVV